MDARNGVLVEVVEMAEPLCRAAANRVVRTGPGRKPVIPDWFLALMIMVAIARGKKSKAAQFRFWLTHRSLLEGQRGPWGFPARSTFYDRYRRAWKVFEVAIELHTKKAIRYRWIDPEVVSVDKSVIPARGKRPGKRNRKQRRVDAEATWTRDDYRGWVYGYSYEIVLSCTRNSLNWPMIASADTASRSETRTLGEKLPRLPSQVKYLLADRGYDADDHCEVLEWDGEHRTRRRFVCPTRRSARGPARKEHKRSKIRQRRQAHRRLRKQFVDSKKGRDLYARRGITIEPFNSWFKLMFDLQDRVWHRGLPNNQTQILAAIFLYQLLLRINLKRNRQNGQIKWLLDTL